MFRTPDHVAGVTPGGISGSMTKSNQTIKAPAGVRILFLCVDDSKLLGHDPWLDVVVLAGLYVRLICPIPMDRHLRCNHLP